MTRRRAGFLIALGLTAAVQAAEKPGDVYAITVDRASSFTTSGGGTGNSTDRDTMIERVISVSNAGLELEYDLPPEATTTDRELGWQYPVRVLKSPDGVLKLLNAADMETRLTTWLTLAKLPRSACGHYYFSWNMFRVECDPQSVLMVVQMLDLRPTDLRDGGSYRDPDSMASATFKHIVRTDGASYVAKMAVDPDTVRRDLARSDIAIGEVTRKPITEEAALDKARAIRISGTITVTFDVDAANNVMRRVKVMNLEIKKPGDVLERRTMTETLDRRHVAPSPR